MKEIESKLKELEIEIEQTKQNLQKSTNPFEKVAYGFEMFDLCKKKEQLEKELGR